MFVCSNCKMESSSAYACAFCGATVTLKSDMEQKADGAWPKISKPLWIAVILLMVALEAVRQAGLLW